MILSTKSSNCHNFVTNIAVSRLHQRIYHWFLYGYDKTNADIIVKIGYDR